MRTALQEELHRLEQIVLAAGAETIDAVESTVGALRKGDHELAAGVIASGRRIEALGSEAERDVAQLLALQAPVASDLRHALALLYCNLHVQSISDYAVTIARLTVAAASVSGAAVPGSRLARADVAAAVVSQALRALVTRDAADIARVVETAAIVDAWAQELQRGVVAGTGADGEASVQLAMIGRSFQRIASHALDIAEQAHYLATGEFRDFGAADPPA